MNVGILAVAATVELMARLVAVPSSTADIPKVNAAQELMATYLGEHGVACTVETMPTGRKVLYASACGEKTPDLMLSVHLDVVPGNPGQYELKQEGAVARAEDAWAAKNPLPADKWGDVLTVTWLGADGGAYNRIPDDANAVFDLRSVAADSADRVEAFLREATGLQVERLSNSLPCASDPAHPLSVALRDTLRRHIPGEAVPFDRLNAATDARCFHDCGVPVMVVAIKGGDGHGSNEWADVPSIDRMQGILEDFALTNFRKK